MLDLLNPHSGRGALPVRWKADRGFYVENLFVVECETEADLLSVLEEGTRYRHIAAHDMNERSSRSHAILTVNIDREVDQDDGAQVHVSCTFYPFSFCSFSQYAADDVEHCHGASARESFVCRFSWQ